MRKLIVFSILFLFVAAVPLVWQVQAEVSNADTDGDGWSDEYEINLGSDPKSAESMPNSLDDPDQDGLTTIQELNAGTDPTDPDTDDDYLSDGQEVLNQNSNPLSWDTDSDGLSDFEEVVNGTDPGQPDTDGDGWLDRAETEAGSDPLNGSSSPKSP